MYDSVYEKTKASLRGKSIENCKVQGTALLMTQELGVKRKAMRFSHTASIISLWTGKWPKPDHVSDKMR